MLSHDRDTALARDHIAEHIQTEHNIDNTRDIHDIHTALNRAHTVEPSNRFNTEINHHVETLLSRDLVVATNSTHAGGSQAVALAEPPPTSIAAPTGLNTQGVLLRAGRRRVSSVEPLGLEPEGALKAVTSRPRKKFTDGKVRTTPNGSAQQSLSR